MQWENFFRPPSGVRGDLSVGLVWLMLIVDIFVYSILTWYIDSVRPGQYGIAKPWYFLCMVSHFIIYIKSTALSLHGNLTSVQTTRPGRLTALSHHLGVSYAPHNCVNCFWELTCNVLVQAQHTAKCELDFCYKSSSCINWRHCIWKCL